MCTVLIIKKLNCYYVVSFLAVSSMVLPLDFLFRLLVTEKSQNVVDVEPVKRFAVSPIRKEFINNQISSILLFISRVCVSSFESKRLLVIDRIRMMI